MIERLEKLHDGKSPEERITKIKNNNFCVEHDYSDTGKVFSYDIPIERCSNHSEVIKWAWHISAKDFITKEQVADFLLVASNYLQEQANLESA